MPSTADWPVVALGPEAFSIRGVAHPGGTTLRASFVCSDVLEVSVACQAERSTPDGHQRFAVLGDDAEAMRLVLRVAA